MIHFKMDTSISSLQQCCSNYLIPKSIKTFKMIHTLPFEIAAKIYGYLSIDEVTSVDIAYREAEYDTYHCGNVIHRSPFSSHATMREFFSNLFNDRISMNLYLGQHFSHSEGLLKCMLINDIYLSGSRALNYFVPGSIGNDSDWDFYSQSKGDELFRFMEFMKSIGVKWVTSIEWFTEKLENDECESGITTKQIENTHAIATTMSTNQNLLDVVNKLATEARDNNEKDEELEIIVKNSKGKDKTFIIRHDVYAMFDIIYGTFNNHGKKQRIQLMIGTQGLQTIMRFYTSVVQCVITGFCAAHMYAKDAYNRQSRIWVAQEDHPISAKKTRDSQRKYEERGYMFYKSSFSTMEFPYQANVVFKRCLKDPDSHVIDYNVDGPWTDTASRYRESNLLSLATYKRMKFYEFSWIQNGRDLSVSDYHNMDMENAKDDAVTAFIKDFASRQPDAEKSGQMLHTMTELTQLTRRFRSLADPVESIMQSQETMFPGYLDEFVKVT